MRGQGRIANFSQCLVGLAALLLLAGALAVRTRRRRATVKLADGMPKRGSSPVWMLSTPTV